MCASGLRYVKLKCNLEIDGAAGFAKPPMPVRFRSWPPTKSNANKRRFGVRAVRDQASLRAPRASAFLTSDCEIPNFLAIAEGLTPALKAAHTAFSLPVVNEPAPSSAASRCRCVFASATGFSFAGLGGRRPRRSASMVTAASRASISTSSNRLSAPARSSGKKWRCCEAGLFGPALPFGTAEGPAAATVGGAEKRSGVVSAGRRVGMPPTMPPVAHRGNSW